MHSAKVLFYVAGNFILVQIIKSYNAASTRLNKTVNEKRYAGGKTDRGYVKTSLIQSKVNIKILQVMGMVLVPNDTISIADRGYHKTDRGYVKTSLIQSKVNIKTFQVMGMVLVANDKISTAKRKAATRNLNYFFSSCVYSCFSFCFANFVIR